MVKEALIDLYIEVKVRNEVSIKAVTQDTISQEKENLRYLDSLDLIEYLRSSIEILLSLNLCQTGTNPTNREPQLTTPSVQCNTSILNRNIPDDDEEGYHSGLLSHIDIPSHRLNNNNEIAKLVAVPDPEDLHLTTAKKQSNAVAR